MGETVNRELLVMRHAKTERSARNDRERGLTARGRADAEAAGRWLRKQRVKPEVVLTSPAVRARDTAELVVAGLAVAPEVRVVEELYEASAEEVLEIVAGMEDDRRSVLVVGHNPTMEELTHLLPGAAADAGEAHLPTAGVVILDVPGRWHQIAAGSVDIVSRHVARG